MKRFGSEMMRIGDLESNGCEKLFALPFCAENSQILKSLLRE